MVASVLPRVGVVLPYTDRVPREETVEFVQEADRLGYESVWVAEAYGYDAITLLSLLACRTERIQLATGIINVFSRTPALIGQTIAGLDDISGGRAILGLGTSGPQVIEGWHGVPFQKGVQRSREVIEIVRMVLRRERVVHQGEVFQLNGGLKLITHPRRPDIPITLATLTDAGVALTAELADRWMPTLYHPTKAPQVFAEALQRGQGKRDPNLEPLQVCPTVAVLIGDPEQARPLLKPNLALYIGGMGSRQRNFYNALVSRYGYAEEARRIQDLYLGGDKQQATELVPDSLVDEVCILGDEAAARRRVAELLTQGVDVPLLSIANPDAEGRLQALHALRPGPRRRGAQRPVLTQRVRDNRGHTRHENRANAPRSQHKPPIATNMFSDSFDMKAETELTPMSHRVIVSRKMTPMSICPAIGEASDPAIARGLDQALR